MRYLLRQKLFCFGDDFQIKDEAGRAAFVVDGAAFSLGKHLSFQDLEGNELVSIQQRLLSWGPTYELSKDGNSFAVVKKELFHVFKYRFTIALADSPGLEAEGDFLDHEYVISREGAPLATVSKRWFSVTDTYGVDIAEDEDDVLVLAITVVIDMVCHADQK